MRSLHNRYHHCHHHRLHAHLPLLTLPANTAILIIIRHHYRVMQVLEGMEESGSEGLEEFVRAQVRR